MAALDHLVVSAATLAEGVASVEAALGVTLTSGGEHPQMGTHNRLMSLGEGLYLEVIAVNPDAPAPGRPRWFDLDNFFGVPRLTNWVIRCENLKEAHTQAPSGCGEIHDLARGDYRWRMAIPVDGRLPFGGAFPGVIEWRGPHPAGRLPDAGCRLRRLVLVHPEAATIGTALFRLVDDPRIAIEQGPETALRAEIDTGRGMRLLA